MLVAYNDHRASCDVFPAQAGIHLQILHNAKLWIDFRLRRKDKPEFPGLVGNDMPHTLTFIKGVVSGH